MSVQNLTVTEDEGEQRLDKWLRRRFPQLNQVAVEKLCRTGQVRVDSARVKASDRVAPGMTVRVPPLPSAPPAPQAPEVAPGTTAATPTDYTIGPGDSLKVFVWRHDDLSATVPA